MTSNYKDLKESLGKTYSLLIVQNDLTPSFLLFICLLASIINGYIFNYLEAIYEPIVDDVFTRADGPMFMLFAACIVAPFVETYLTQVLPFQLFQKLGITNFFVLLFIPALLFGLLHGTNPLMLLNKTIGGLILNYLYLNLKLRSKNAYIYVVVLHSLYNLYGFLLVSDF
jgi:membrane protease YdiL (CAAX protease family)